MDTSRINGHFNKFPIEIYIIIFNYLEPKDLITCLFVNTTWRNILKNCTRINWQKIAANALSCDGVEMKTKSKLDWWDIIIRSGQWLYKMDKVKIDLVHEYKGLENYEPLMTVYKDKLRAYSFKKAIYDINIENDECQREENTDWNIIGETDHIRIYHDGIKIFKMVKKTEHDNRETTLIMEYDAYVLYLLHDNVFYILEDDKYLRSFTWLSNQWINKYIARYYGTTKINSMVVHRRKLYLLDGRGDLWTVKKNQFVQQAVFVKTCRHVERSSKDLLKAILSVTRRGTFYGYDDVCDMFKKPIICSFFHAGVLFLAYSNGQVEAWVLRTSKTFVDYNMSHNDEVAFHKQVLDNISSVRRPSPRNPVEVDLFIRRRYSIIKVNGPVLSMDVYEGEMCSYLFINCGHTIYKCRLTFPDG